MSHFTETRTARKRHGPCEICRYPIEPGQRYQRFSATPRDEIWSGERWTHLVAHAPYRSCAEPDWHPPTRTPDHPNAATPT